MTVSANTIGYLNLGCSGSSLALQLRSTDCDGTAPNTFIPHFYKMSNVDRLTAETLVLGIDTHDFITQRELGVTRQAVEFLELVPSHAPSPILRVRKGDEFITLEWPQLQVRVYADATVKLNDTVRHVRHTWIMPEDIDRICGLWKSTFPEK
jgi:hypothetical protein